ncbi:hypothetical protein [Streptomyces sp. NPDC055189]
MAENKPAAKGRAMSDCSTPAHDGTLMSGPFTAGWRDHDACGVATRHAPGPADSVSRSVGRELDCYGKTLHDWKDLRAGAGDVRQVLRDSRPDRLAPEHPLGAR